MILVDVVNTGKVPVFVFNPNLPTNDRPTGRDLYDVVDAKSRHALFVGEIWDEHPETTNFTRIEPGQHIVSKYDLGRNYKLTPGPNEISFKPVTYYSGPYDVNTANVAALRLGKTESNTLKLWINDALLKKQSVALLKPAGAPTFGSCSATQTTAATAAFSAAKALAIGGMSYYSSHTTPDPHPILPTDTVFTPTQRYSWWFGYSAPLRSVNRVMTPDWYPTIFIWSLNAALSNAAKNPQISCDPCPGQPAAAAKISGGGLVVQGDYSGKSLVLCPHFFELSASGTNSQPGVILHEMTHFPQEWSPEENEIDDIPATGDIEESGNLTTVHELAVQHPDQAVTNADNYEYFYENNPPKT